MKTTVAALCVLLLAALMLPLAVSLLASVPAVQNAVARRLTTVLSEKYGLRVSFDRIEMTLVNNVEVTGLYVEDLKGDTLLYAHRLSAPIVELGLMGEPLTFGRVKLSGAEMWLRRDSLGTLNIREVLTAIRDGKPVNPDPQTQMRIMSIEADSLTFGILREDEPLRAEGMDFSRFVIRDARTSIEDFAVAHDTIRMDVRSLTFDERSGFHGNDISVHDLVVSRGAVSLDNTTVLAHGSELRVSTIRLTSSEGDWKDFRRFNDSISLDVTMAPSRLSSELLGYFIPAAADWGLMFEDFSAYTRGTVASLSGGIENARTLDTALSLDFRSSGLPNLDKMRVDVDLAHLTTDGGDIDTLFRTITGKTLPEAVVASFERMGAIAISGKITDNAGRISAATNISSDAGNADLTATVGTVDTEMSLGGELAFSDLDLGQVFAIADMGTASGMFSLAGSLHGSGMVHGEISSLEFRDHTYTGITLDGRSTDGKIFEGTLSARDTALSIDLAATVDRGAPTPKYDLTVEIERMDLAAAGLDRRDSISVLSGSLAASVSARSLDDLNGEMRFRDMTYTSHLGTVTTPLAVVSARNGEGGKFLALDSEFADAEYRGSIPYRDMIDYLGSFIDRYIPSGNSADARSLPAGERDVAVGGNAESDDGDVPAGENKIPSAPKDSEFRLNVKNTAPLLGVLTQGTEIAAGSSVCLRFNPRTDAFSISAEAPFVEHGGSVAFDVHLWGDNSADSTDSLRMHLTGSEILTATRRISAFSLGGGVKNGRGRMDISFDRKLWRVETDSVAYGRGRMVLDDMRIFSANNAAPHLTASGVISRMATDTLNIRLNRFDLSPLGELIKVRDLRTEGRATGYLDVSSVLRHPKISADVNIIGLSLGGIEAAPLHFSSSWDEADKTVRFSMLNGRTNAHILYGTLASDRRVDAAAEIDSIDLALLDPLLGGILEGTSGKANVRLTIGGTPGDLRIDGLIEVPRLETTVGYTKASYTITGGEMRIENSVLTLTPTRVHDRYGGEGELSMTVDVTNPGGMLTRIDARMNRLLTFDTDSGDNDVFYGRVFSSGTASIRSQRRATRMDISARTDAGTRFHLPLGESSNISWADFVVFADGSGALDTADVLSRKRLLYERRLASGTRAAARDNALDLNLSVNVTPDAELHMLIDPNLGEGITANGEGLLSMSINPATDLFTMTGDYNITGGRFEFSMMNVFNKDFVITPGSSLRWSGTPDDALLDVEASYRVRTSLLPLIGEGSALISERASVPVDCILQLRGRLSEPEITFDIALPSADSDARLIAGNAMNTQELKSMQFLSLLTTGSFATDNSITGQSANTGAMASGAVGFDILTNQLNNFLSSEDWDVYFRYRPQDNFMSNQFDVGFSTGFIDNRLLLEIEGNYVDDRAAASVGTGGNASNLAGDVSLTWVIDRSGNLRLKVFSQTIDRLNETQGLQESGLGVYWKKDFESIRDIFRRKSVGIER